MRRVLARHRASASLSWGELAEGTVPPRGVVVPEVLHKHLSQAVLVDDQQPAGISRRRVQMNLSQIVSIRGACGALAMILMPSAINTASRAASRHAARESARRGPWQARDTGLAAPHSPGSAHVTPWQ
jgi:hypothetical protein